MNFPINVVFLFFSICNVSNFSPITIQRIEYTNESFTILLTIWLKLLIHSWFQANFTLNFTMNSIFFATRILFQWNGWERRRQKDARTTIFWWSNYFLINFFVRYWMAVAVLNMQLMPFSQSLNCQWNKKYNKKYWLQFHLGWFHSFKLRCSICLYFDSHHLFDLLHQFWCRLQTSWILIRLTH